MAAALWGVFLVGMHWSGKLDLFQAWPYYHFSGAAGLLLVLLAAKAALWPSRVACSCGHDHAPDEPCAEGDDGAAVGMDDNPAGEKAADGETECTCCCCGHDHDDGHDHGHRHDDDQGQHEHDEHQHAPRHELDESERRVGPQVAGLLLLGLLMAPALAGVLVPHRALTSFAAAKRMAGEMDSSNLLQAMQQRKREWQLGGKDYQPVTTLDVLDIGEQSPGLKVSTVGFVLKPLDGLPADVARIARFRMTCCAADAMPIVVLVRGPEAASLRADSWVEVRGTVRREMIVGRETTVLVVDPETNPHDGIQEVPPPKNQYI